MSLQIDLVNLGSYPNDGTGDDLRVAFEKSNANFLSVQENVVLSAANLGAGVPIWVDKIDNNLRFRGIKTINSNMAISYDSADIVLDVKDSINSLQEDPNPKLGGDLDLNNYAITNIGSITASAFFGNLTGNVDGDILRNNTSLTIQALNLETNDYLAVYLNALSITGNSLIAPGTTSISTYTGDGLIINSDLQLVLQSNAGVLIDTTLTVTNDIFGNVTGQVSSIANHTLSDLGDVLSVSPTSGQALIWNGSNWAPANISSVNGVSKIVAGNNIAISPTNGVGEVTINSTASGTGVPQDYDFGLLSGIRNPFDLILQFTYVDFSSLNEPSNLNLNLGFISGSDTSIGSAVNGGGPGTITFDSIVTGGSPNTSAFDEIADGGLIISILEGGAPSGGFTYIASGGTPAQNSSLQYDGGIVT